MISNCSDMRADWEIKVSETSETRSVISVDRYVEYQIFHKYMAPKSTTSGPPTITSYTAVLQLIDASIATITHQRILITLCNPDA